MFSPASSAEVKVKVEKGVRTEPQTVYELSDSDLDASAPGSGIIGLDDSESDKESEQRGSLHRRILLQCRVDIPHGVDVPRGQVQCQRVERMHEL
jgi:hypothetical protein